MTVAERPTADVLDEASDPVPVVRAAGLVKQYGHGLAERRALDGVDFEVHAGRFVAIVGRSGSGKSTLLHLLGALDIATDGDVWFEGTSLRRADEAARTDIRRSRVGFVFQQYNLLPVLTGRDNVALPLVIARTPAEVRERRVARAIQMVGLDDEVCARRPAELSGGEQQRIAIARALVTEPALILADEPTGALDTDTSRLVLSVLRRICDESGCSVVLATHDPAAAAIADEIVRLQDGRIVDRHIVSPAPLEELFGRAEPADDW